MENVEMYYNGVKISRDLFTKTVQEIEQELGVKVSDDEIRQILMEGMVEGVLEFKEEENDTIKN